MRWRRALLVPHIIWLTARAPRDASTVWDRYWADVDATGDGGDVLWDPSSSAEASRYVDLLVAHADLALPVVDVGCGNGRFTRSLASRFTRAVGVDLSPHAVARAERENAGTPGLTFRTADLTSPGEGARLADELGACNVFVRGVMHVLDPPARRRMAANLGDLLGPRGVALIAETNYSGPLLGYLESLGAGPTGFPRPLARALAAGLPRPSPFGDAELADAFPPATWDRVVIDPDARITTVPLHRARSDDTIPGHLAVLRRRSASR